MHFLCEDKAVKKTLAIILNFNKINVCPSNRSDRTTIRTARWDTAWRVPVPTNHLLAFSSLTPYPESCPSTSRWIGSTFPTSMWVFHRCFDTNPPLKYPLKFHFLSLRDCFYEQKVGFVWHSGAFLLAGMCSGVMCSLNHLPRLNKSRVLPGNLAYPSKNSRSLIVYFRYIVITMNHEFLSLGGLLDGIIPPFFTLLLHKMPVYFSC